MLVEIPPTCRDNLCSLHGVLLMFATKMKCAIIEYAKRKWETIKNGEYDEKT